jgi:hypothetical protein
MKGNINDKHKFISNKRLKEFISREKRRQNVVGIYEFDNFHQYRMKISFLIGFVMFFLGFPLFLIRLPMLSGMGRVETKLELLFYFTYLASSLLGMIISIKDNTVKKVKIDTKNKRVHLYIKFGLRIREIILSAEKILKVEKIESSKNLILRLFYNNDGVLEVRKIETKFYQYTKDEINEMYELISKKILNKK